MKVLNMSTKLTKFSNLIILCVIFCVILVTISTKESKIEYYSDLNGPIVKIPGLGILHGSITFGLWTNKTIYQFLGVKYAKSPSGSRRFKVSSMDIELKTQHIAQINIPQGFLGTNSRRTLAWRTKCTKLWTRLSTVRNCICVR